MAMLGDGDSTSRTHNSQFNHPYGYQPPVQTADDIAAQPPPRSQADIDYELKVPIAFNYLINIIPVIVHSMLLGSG